jgi:hypothetical protein
MATDAFYVAVEPSRTNLDIVFSPWSRVVDSTIEEDTSTPYSKDGPDEILHPDS